MFLHLGCLLFVPFCIAATWWQITRAEDGNGLSYLYTFEWPVFAIVGIYFWWQFLHTDYDNVGLRGMRKQAAEASTSDVSADGTTDAARLGSRHPDADPSSSRLIEPATTLATTAPSGSLKHNSPRTTAPATPAPADQTPARTTSLEDENPELAAYNARLAALSASGAKTWRKPETPIARRPQ